MAFDALNVIAGLDLAPQVKEYPEAVPGLVLHVDGDYLAYYASGNDECTEQQSRQNVRDLIDSFKLKTGATSVVMHNTAKGCQKGERYLIATVKPYQGQRDGDRKPKNHGYLQNWLQTYDGPMFKTKNWLTREADDGIAACALYACGRAPGYIAIATADKDLRMLPGLHITWKTQTTVVVPPGGYDVEHEGKQYGLKFFFHQLLMGDAADNCPGLEKYTTVNSKGEKCHKPVGEKTALLLLGHCTNVDEAYRVVSAQYAGYYGDAWADRLCEQMGLLWMRCGNDAGVADFARHVGHSRINSTFCPEMWAAVERLETRVKDARAEINNFSNSAG